MRLILLLFLTAFSSTLTAQIVNIPDPAFKQILVNYDSYFGVTIDTNNDGEIQYSEAAGMTGTLNVGDPWLFSGNIQDLTGIEAFVNITELNCANNQLTTLDLSQNTALVKVVCSHNQLVSLNVSQCSALEELNCKYNQLTTLDVTQNIALQNLGCSHNQLSDLVLNQNLALSFLVCSNNKLATLDLTQNINLEQFSSYDNHLTFLDIRNSNNTNIAYFSVVNNPNLSCIFVDDANYSTNNLNWYKDPTATYIETQQECNDLAGIADFWRQHIKIYPNPVKNFINIELFRYNPYKLKIRDLSGKILLDTQLKTLNSKLNISHLQNGIYFLSIQNYNNQSVTRKIIKL